LPRGIVYDDPTLRQQYASLAAETSLSAIAPKARYELRRRAGANVSITNAPATASPPGLEKDGFATKIAKYVPAEVVTVVSLGFAAFPPHGTTVWAWVGAGAVVNVLYLLSSAVAQPNKYPRPRWYFYLLSAIAFVLWATAVLGPVRHEAGLTGRNEAAQQTFLLAAAAFALPLLDTLLGWLDDAIRLRPRRGTPNPASQGDPVATAPRKRQSAAESIRREG
jgi:hypothetical protein